MKQTPEMANEAIIALISDHALMRHQYQRRINTSPVPAPSANKKRQAPSTDDSCQVTSVEPRNKATVAKLLEEDKRKVLLGNGVIPPFVHAFGLRKSHARID